MEPSQVDTIDARAFESIKRALKEKGRGTYRVVSGSMEPVISTGEIIEVAPIAFDRVERFDILVFWNGNLLISHYVWHFNLFPDAGGRRTVVTRPLRYRGEDLPVPEEQILGRVESHRIPTRWRARLILREVVRRMRNGIFS